MLVHVACNKSFLSFTHDDISPIVQSSKSIKRKNLKTVFSFIFEKAKGDLFAFIKSFSLLASQIREYLNSSFLF